MTHTEKPLYDGVQVYRRLVGYALQYWQYLLLAVIGLVVSAATQPLFSWILVITR